MITNVFQQPSYHIIMISRTINNNNNNIIFDISKPKLHDNHLYMVQQWNLGTQNKFLSNFTYSELSLN